MKNEKITIKDPATWFRLFPRRLQHYLNLNWYSELDDDREVVSACFLPFVCDKSDTFNANPRKSISNVDGEPLMQTYKKLHDLNSIVDRNKEINFFYSFYVDDQISKGKSANEEDSNFEFLNLGLFSRVLIQALDGAFFPGHFFSNEFLRKVECDIKSFKSGMRN